MRPCSHLASHVNVSCPHSNTLSVCPLDTVLLARCTKNSRYCGRRRNLCTAGRNDITSDYCILLYTTVYYCRLLYTTVYYCRLLRITVLIASPSLYASWEGRAAMTVCRMTGSSCPVRSRSSRGEGAVVESVRVCVWRGTYSFYSYRRPCHGAYHGWP